MRIRNFVVRNQRAVRLAGCDDAPRIMVITGPNGCGKSTLLNALRSAGEGDGRTLYVGPHRNSRRQDVRMRFLGQQRIEMSSLLSSANLPGFEGMHMPSNIRDAWNFDEAQSFLKYSLCQIELERQNAIASRFDETGAVNRADMPDVWAPLRELAHNLLPHLNFHRIDLTNRDQIKCLWNVHNKDVQVDIDDLSSGEKAVIQLFFPLVEHRVNQNLAKMRGTELTSSQGSVAVLMDEPELHLHPNLQAKILDYMRGLSIREGVQFILATHSPSMVEHASNDELYLLRPSELLDHDINQLVRIADNEERLAAIRSLFGSTSNATALRTVLVVEGRSVERSSRRPADAKIYGFLSDRFGQLTVLAGGGNSECKALVKSLNDCLPTLAGNLKAVALLDRDTLEESPTHQDQFWLPVSMIENLLIDPDAIFHATETVRHKTNLRSPEDVAIAIDNVLTSLHDHEMDRRIKAGVDSRTFRLIEPVAAARQQVEAFTNTMLTELTEDKFAQLRNESAQKVAALGAANRRREMYDGKRILDEFFKQHIHSTGMSKEIFVYLCAKEAAARTSVATFVESLFSALGIEPVAPSAA